MPFVCKPSAVCSPCLVLNLSSLAAIPAWAPPQPGRSDTFLCPPQSRGGAGAGSGESRRGLWAQVSALGGRWALWGLVASLGGRQAVSTVSESRAVCPGSRESLCCCLGHRAAAHHLPRGNSGCARTSRLPGKGQAPSSPAL